MPIGMHSFLPSCLHCIILTIVVALLVPTTVHSLTLDTDKQVLRLLKCSIDPNTIPRASFISSWDFSFDPCESTGGQFQGILCTIPLDNSSSRISAIDLDSVGYDGFLTLSIGNLTELTTLNLGQNSFRGPIPDSISNLKKLTTLSLSGNFFTGSIPVGVCSLKNLKSLDLSYNNLSGTIPTKLSGLRSLIRLSLYHNKLSGRIPNLTGSWQLQTLELGRNLLYGTLPKFPVNLRNLSLSHNSLSGHISSIGKLENLLTLDLSNNRFTGLITWEILTLPMAVRIDVSANRLTAVEVATSGRETQLEELDARGNLLQGRLPLSLVTLGSLTSINLSRNRFLGPIPMQYAEKLGKPWRRLYLDHNFLKGNLPPQFGGVASVRVIGSLAGNCLSCPVNVTLCRGGQRPASECA